MKLFSHFQIWLALCLLAADSLFFSLTNPSSVPSFALVVGFVLLLVTVYCLMRGFLLVCIWYGLPIGKHQLRLARIATGLFGGLIALQSIGELSLRDVLVVLPLAILAYLYLSYGQANPVSAA